MKPFRARDIAAILLDDLRWNHLGISFYDGMNKKLCLPHENSRKMKETTISEVSSK